MKSGIFHWNTYCISRRLSPMPAHSVQIHMRVLPFRKSSSICDRDSIVKIAENVRISNALFLHSLGESRDCKYVAISPAVLMLSIKIIVFGIADAPVVGDTRKSNSSNLGFFISVTMYVIFGRSSDSLYSRIDSRSCKDSQTYSNTLGVTVADNAKVGIFGNVSFKCPIKPYFFRKLFQLQSKCASSTTIHANRRQNSLFRFRTVLC